MTTSFHHKNETRIAAHGQIIGESSRGFVLAKPYRCGICGWVEGIRSRPRTFLERFFLPLFL